MIGLNRTSTRRPFRRIVVVVAAMLLVFVGSTAAAYALWRTTASAGFSASAATVPPPTGLTCVAGNKDFALRWVAPATTPTPTGYHVLRNGVPVATITGLSWTSGEYPLAGNYAVRSMLGSSWVSVPSPAIIVTVPNPNSQKPVC